MTKPIVEVSNVSKSYQLGAIGATRLLDDVNRVWRRALGKEKAVQTRLFNALTDVCFDVQPGDVVGLIGSNGAGKSTLLKVLSRITEPTSGSVVLRGRVASLLEVGTGFVGDLTGRENIYLNGAILGMSRAETRAKFDEIVAFAEVDRFIDTPVKRYSSGMYVRLAFAVAAHLEPEILIVDEVLAVGDAQFQRKCLGKMNDVSSQGRTILFVSHNMTAMQSLCKRAILLAAGRVVVDGLAGPVITRYLQEGSENSSLVEWTNNETAPGNDSLRIRSIRIQPVGETPEGMLTMQAPVSVETEFVSSGNGTRHITYHLLNDDGITVLTTGCPPQKRSPGVYQASFQIPAHLLNSGRYFLKLLVVEDESTVSYSRDSLVSFTVHDSASRDGAVYGREPGVVQVRLPWSIVAKPDMITSAPEFP